MEKKFFSLLILFSALAFLLQAQPDTSANTGVIIQKDNRIDDMVSRLTTFDKDQPVINGYRILIYSGSNRKDANKAKSDFLASFPDVTVYLDYLQPNYKVKAGDFRNRIEAQKLYHSLIDNPDFKSVLIVPDKIYLPEL